MNPLPLLILLVCSPLFFPVPALAKPAPDKKTAEEQVRFWAPIIAADLPESAFRVRCHRDSYYPGQWICYVGWVENRGTVGAMQCFNDHILNTPVEIYWDDLITVCELKAQMRAGQDRVVRTEWGSPPTLSLRKRAEGTHVNN